jgi:hypothetical protein
VLGNRVDNAVTGWMISVCHLRTGRPPRRDHPVPRAAHPPLPRTVLDGPLAGVLVHGTGALATPAIDKGPGASSTPSAMCRS